MFQVTDQMIKDSHPLKTKRYDIHDEAYRLVGQRHDKGDLVDLVGCLLEQIEVATKTERQRCSEVCTSRAVSIASDVNMNVPAVNEARKCASAILTEPGLNIFGEKLKNSETLKEIQNAK